MTLLPLGGYAPCTWNNGYEGYRVMANKLDQPMVYQIRIKGHLGPQWADWFGGLTITLEEGGETLLTCLVVDQAALYGLLRKVRDLGLPLISVTRAQTDQIDGPTSKQPIEASALERKQDGGNKKAELD
jgi:hypothetical protein